MSKPSINHDVFQYDSQTYKLSVWDYVRHALFVLLVLFAFGVVAVDYVSTHDESIRTVKKWTLRGSITGE